MHRRVVASLALVSFSATACFVPPEAKADTAFGTTFATRFVHRGMTLVDRPVLQPKLAAALPTNWGDRVGVTVEASMDLKNNTGDAWFPDGHAGRFTQIEMQGSYTKTIGDITVSGGVHSYNLPNGTEFRFSNAGGERGGTTEVFATASANVLEANPYVSVHYDFDEVRGGYYRGGLREDIPIAEGWSIALDGSLSYVSEAQSAWMYAFNQSGLADLRGEVVLKYKYDPRTEISLGAHGSLIVDDDIDEWFTALGIDDDPIWFTLGIAWAF
jgi:hypothetical protein